MRIAVDASRAFKQPRTGTEYYAWEILRGLLAYPQAAQDQWLLFVDHEPPAREFDRLTQHVSLETRAVAWQILPWRRLWTHRVLGPAVRRAGVDVLFVPSHVIPFVWPVRCNPPTVVTVHDLGYRHWPQTHPLTQRLYLEASTRWNLYAAAQVIGVSQATVKDIRAHYDTPPARLHVIHEAAATVSAPEPSSAPDLDLKTIAATQAEFGLPPAYAIFTGTLHPRKNITRLIEAYARLRWAGRVEWALVLAGAGGWQAEQFRARVAALDLSDHVHFLGYVPQAALPALVAGARFFAFPSLFEGFGLPVLEAQSLGVPVMTSNYSSLPEVAGDAALYVDPTDVDAIAAAMLRLSQDEDLREQLRTAGYENVKRFSWEKAADETYAVLQQAAQAGGAAVS